MKRVLERSKAEALPPRLAYIMSGKEVVEEEEAVAVVVVLVSVGLKRLSSEEGACNEKVIVLLLERPTTACTSPVDVQQRLLGGIERIKTREESTTMEDDAALEACDGATVGEEVTATFMMPRYNLSK